MNNKTTTIFIAVLLAAFVSLGFLNYGMVTSVRKIAETNLAVLTASQPSLGGSTSANWSVGGNLSVTGTSALTGAATLSGGVIADKLRFGTSGIKTISGSATTTSISAADVCDYSGLNWTPTIASATATLPTAAALIADCLPTWGDTKDLYFRNLSTDTATSTLLVAGASTTVAYINASSTTNTILQRIYGTETALLKFLVATTTANSNMVEVNVITFR